MPSLRLSHWGSSVALHGCALLALLALQAGLRQPAPKPTIDWDVAMVSAVAPPATAAAAPPPPDRPLTKTPAMPPPPRDSSQPLERQAAPIAAPAPAPFVAPTPANSAAVAPIAPSAPPPAVLPEKPLADSAWLTDALWGMMNGRKRYPLQARRMGLEGKVIIEADIDEHGQIIRAEIKQSAGSSLLDQDALALLKSAAPLKVDRYRLAPRTRVLIPVAYVLE